MIRTKSVITFLLFLLLFAPSPECLKAQSSSSSETTIMDESTINTDNTKDKKKDKTKDVIEITEKFFWCLAINIASMALIILLIYYPNYRKMEFIFTFIMFNIVIFLLTFVLNEVKISMGAAFGLFAVFSMLRYRTEGISMKDMTYLFIFIGIGLISAIQLDYDELAIINGIIIIITFIMDGRYIIRREFSKSIQYENIELIKPENQAALLEDLKKRTGLNIHRFTINKVDFLRDTAIIRIYFYEK